MYPWGRLHSPCKESSWGRSDASGPSLQLILWVMSLRADIVRFLRVIIQNNTTCVELFLVSIYYYIICILSCKHSHETTRGLRTNHLWIYTFSQTFKTYKISLKAVRYMSLVRYMSRIVSDDQRSGFCDFWIKPVSPSCGEAESSCTVKQGRVSLSLCHKVGSGSPPLLALSGAARELHHFCSLCVHRQHARSLRSCSRSAPSARCSQVSITHFSSVLIIGILHSHTHTHTTLHAAHHRSVGTCVTIKRF